MVGGRFDLAIVFVLVVLRGRSADYRGRDRSFAPPLPAALDIRGISRPRVHRSRRHRFAVAYVYFALELGHTRYLMTKDEAENDRGDHRKAARAVWTTGSSEGAVIPTPET